MLFVKETIKTEDINKVSNFFKEFDSEIVTVSPEEIEKESNVTKYVTSLACGQYKKAVEDIENTHIGNKLKRKRSFQQVMQESFFYGANRFGNNFIA